MFTERPDVQTWLKTVEPKDLHGYPGGVVYEGEAVWVPAGYVPLWMGLPTDVDLSSENVKLAPRGKPAQQVGQKMATNLYEETTTAGLVMHYDPEAIPPSDAVKTALFANYTASSIFPGSLRVGGFSEYMELLKPSVPAAASAVVT